ncbi:DUF3951 domain-containing protein [Jeotgalibacillus sp. ET6]|uniref:DUF3951 domain-containing protein n=1 Tax=Jeotgalibacillus sp. ET6 TaxID=3037260 RepID=UPI002418B916|nr:DUF3951 domain-containing protein [Jeotgalibacillus sp. ET6]MDG5473718.1 DUF3951 domain-containing protein [Jeotgalibacillus sp. ET6]
MYISIALMSALVLFICIVVLTVAFKMFIRKETPTNFYTPFDYIAGQDHNEFHEERKEDEQAEEIKEGDKKER